MQTIDFSNLSHAFALTGGIASGKSSVSKLLSLKGFSVLDADKAARLALDEQKDEVVQAFGSKILDGLEINRKALAAIIFSNKDERARLNAIMFPAIKRHMFKDAIALEDKYVRDKKNQYYFLDIPLFFEQGYEIKKLLMILINKDVQLKRLMERDKCSSEEALLKINAQMDLFNKRHLATHIIDNSFSFEELSLNVDQFVGQLSLS